MNSFDARTLALWLVVSAPLGLASERAPVTETAPTATAASSRPLIRDRESPAIDVARRDLERIKSLRNLGLEGKGEAPQLSLPRLQTGEPLSAPSSTTRSAPLPPSQKTNWLLEAMDRKERVSPGREADDRVRERDGVGDNARTRSGRSDSTPAGLEQRSPAANPFSQFLGQWMTSQDYALLGAAIVRTSGENAFDSTKPLSPHGNRPFPASAEVQIGHRTLGGGPGTEPAGIPGTTLPANPYLDNAPSTRTRSAAGSLGPSRLPVAGWGPVAPTLVAPPPAPPRSSASPPIPEFVRPDSDEKYFRPLKRF